MESARRVKHVILMIRDVIMRPGYEALAWSLVRTSIAPRFVIVETVRMAGWKWVRR